MTTDHRANGERPMTVAIHGYYGLRNAGDELILAVILERLRSHLPQAEPVVISGDPAWTARVHGVRAVDSGDLAAVAACVRESTLVISGGGGLFQDHWPRDNAEMLTFPASGVASYAQVPLLAKLYGRPIAMLAHGVGPIGTDEGARLTRFAFGLADRVTTRDEASSNLLRELGYDGRVDAVAPDPAYAAPIPSSDEARRELERHVDLGEAPSTLIAVCARPWEPGGADWPQALADGLDAFLETSEATVVFIPFQTYGGDHDETASREILSRMEHADRCRIAKPDSPARTVAFVAACDAAVAMRLHAAIIAMAAAVPVLALAYDPKVSETMAQCGQEERVVPLAELDPADFARRLSSLLKDRADVSRQLERAAARQRRDVETHFQGLADLAATAPVERAGDLPLVDLKAQAVLDLRAKLEESAGWSKALETSLKDLEKRLKDATDELSRSVAEVSTLQARAELREGEMQTLSERLAEREADVERLDGQLSDITRSTGWQLLQVLWRVRLFLAPRNSLRERLGRLMMRGLRAWRRDGIVGFPLRIVGRVLRRPLALVRGTIATLTRPARRVLTPLVPKSLKQLYRESRKEHPFVDRTEVVLYADASILPAYEPRRPLGKLRADGHTAELTVSLIAPVLNEEASAREWLDSLLNQSRRPDEVVIVDGGSTDRTAEIIQEFARSAPFSVRLLEAPGVTIARGRNIAIENARGPIVACTDFGCTLDKDWLRLIVAPFAEDSSIDLSIGYSPPTNLEPSRAGFLVPDLDEINPEALLPPGRCVAMKKSLWARVGGYAEWLTYAGEDTLFGFQAKGIPSRWSFVPQARVNWQGPETIRQTFRTVFRYAKGDGEAGLFAGGYWQRTTHVFGLLALLGIGTLTAVLSALFLPIWALAASLAVLAVAALATGRSLVRPSRVRLGPLGFVSHTIVSLTVVLAQTLGFFAGVINRPGVEQRKRELYGQRLGAILAEHEEARGIIVYPPTHDWGFMFQRPHQMARALARKGYLYFYCTENARTDAVDGFHELEPSLYLCHVPLDTFSTIEKPIVYIGGAPWHCRELPLFDHPRVVYDHYDDLQVSTGKWEDHETLLREAEVVVTTSQRLWEAARPRRPNALLVPNGVDFDYIQRSRPQPSEPAPADWKPIAAAGKPIIGYSGALAEWFDYELLAYVAKARPDLEFVLIGVNYDGSIDRTHLLDLPNVHWLGMKDYDELFKYVWRFDVAIIPFRINDITLSTSPIKLFEYMACAKPTVSSALPECKRYEEVFVAETYADFADRLDQALAARRDETYLSRIERLAREHTWDNRAETIAMALENGAPAGDADRGLLTQEASPPEKGVTAGVEAPEVDTDKDVRSLVDALFSDVSNIPSERMVELRRTIEGSCRERDLSPDKVDMWQSHRFRLHLSAEWLRTLILDDIIAVDAGEATVATDVLRWYFPTVRWHNTVRDLRFRWEFDNDFADLIVAMEVLEHLGDPSAPYQGSFHRKGLVAMLQECFRVLKPGGYLFVTTPNAASVCHLHSILSGQTPWFYQPHVREYTIHDLWSEFEKVGFEIHRLRTVHCLTVDLEYDCSRIFTALLEQGFETENRGDDIFLVARKPERGQA